MNGYLNYEKAFFKKKIVRTSKVKKPQLSFILEIV